MGCVRAFRLCVVGGVGREGADWLPRFKGVAVMERTCAYHSVTAVRTVSTDLRTPIPALLIRQFLPVLSIASIPRRTSPPVARYYGSFIMCTFDEYPHEIAIVSCVALFALYELS